MSVPPKTVCLNKVEALAYIQGDYQGALHMSSLNSDATFIDTIDLFTYTFYQELDRLPKDYFSKDTGYQNKQNTKLFGDMSEVGYFRQCATSYGVRGTLLAMFHHAARSAVLRTVANLLRPKFPKVTDFSSHVHTTPVAPVAQDPIVVSGSSITHQSIPTIGAMDVDLPDITQSQTPASSSGKKQVDEALNLESAPTNTSALKSPKKKSKQADDRRPKKIITGLSLSDSQKPFIRDILLYDVPANWSPEEIMNQLTAWGTPLSMNIKCQRKYQTVRLRIALNSFTTASFDSGSWTYTPGSTPVRWFPGAWTLKQRKVREKFVLALRNIPDDMYKQQLWDRANSHTFLKSQNVKSFKLIRTNKGEKMLLGYFEKYDDYVKALRDSFTLNNIDYRWSKTVPPPPSPNKKKSGSSSSRQPQKPTNSNRVPSRNTSKNKKSEKGFSTTMRNDNKAELLKLLVSLLS